MQCATARARRHSLTPCSSSDCNTMSRPHDGQAVLGKTLPYIRTTKSSKNSPEYSPSVTGTDDWSRDELPALSMASSTITWKSSHDNASTGTNVLDTKGCNTITRVMSLLTTELRSLCQRSDYRFGLVQDTCANGHRRNSINLSPPLRRTQSMVRPEFGASTSLTQPEYRRQM